MTGIVFDIQRFSLHDGPGIRTTVFLKGCPLSCIWCANPESQSLQPQLGYITKNCQHCFSCINVCPLNAHQQKAGAHVLEFDLCRQCGTCVSACPHNALKMIGESMSVDEVMNTALKDRAYYDKSNGGLTLSGGEPTVQFDFLTALLKSAKSQNIHTCIETAGHAALEKVHQLLPLVDCFLFDFKIYDDNFMRTYVGVSNSLILQNLQMLNDNDAMIILRCPIIPGINDSKAHFMKIAELVGSMKNITKVQIMPYHDFGRSKAAEIGQSFAMHEKATSTELAATWVQQLVELGCPNVEHG